MGGIQQRSERPDLAGPQNLGRLPDAIVLGDHVPDPPPHHRIGEPAQRRIEIVDVTQRGKTEDPARLLAAGAASGVLAVHESVGGLGVEHQQLETGSGQVESHLIGVVAAAVEEQRVVGGAQDRRRLVHQAGRRADELVLAALRQPGAVEQPDVQRVQVGEGGEDGALERGGGGESRPDRDVGGQHQIGAADRVTGLLERPDDAGHVGLPAAHPGPEVVRAEALGRALVERTDLPAAVVARGGGDPHPLGQRERHHEPVVVVGVFADQVHPAREPPTDRPRARPVR